MATKFAQFLTDNKIDPRRLLVVSKRLERLGATDRRIKLEKRRTKQGGAAPAAEGEKKAPEKRKSGRPVTDRLLSAATAGKPVAGPAKTRLLRAVNRVLEQKKKPAVELKTLF
jgi:hypothetical protein